MKNLTHTLVLMALLAPIACGEDVPDLNFPRLEDVINDPTPSKINPGATGLLIGARRDIPAPNGYVAMLGILGRELYNFDAADSRFITEMLLAQNLDPGSPAFGGSFWNNPYRNIRNAVILLAALDKVSDEEYPAPDKEAARGFIKTILAYEYLMLINTRDTNGAVIVTSIDINTLDPIKTKAEVFAYIAMLLDEAKTHLMAEDAEFEFPLSSGFEGFDTPATFLKFNRALKARVEAYRASEPSLGGNYQLVLDALAESFITDSATDPKLDLGVYHVFGTGSGDTLNGLNSPNLFVHPSIISGAEMNGSMIDARIAAKTKTVPSRSVLGLTSDKGFTAYESPTAPVPIIRNEELILLRAEANIGLGKIPEAATDLNFIRVQSGHLAPRNDITAANALDELLKQREYSLLFEGGHRWIDARRFGRVAMLPLDLPTHHIHALFPIPKPETDARQ